MQLTSQLFALLMLRGDLLNAHRHRGVDKNDNTVAGREFITCDRLQVLAVRVGFLV